MNCTLTAYSLLYLLFEVVPVCVSLSHIIPLSQKYGGLQTPFPGTMTTGYTTPSADLDLIKIGEARKSLVGIKLDQVCALVIV